MDRTPLIDFQTFEIIDEVREIIAGADKTDKKLDSHDISYMHGLLKAVIMQNSTPAEGAPDPKVSPLERVRQVGRKLVP